MQKAKKGFSLVEMLVALGVALLLSAILLPLYGSTRTKFALLRNAYQLAQNIRMAREMAISARTVTVGKAYGYGAYLREGYSYYIIYVDKNNNKRYNAAQELLQQINLDRGVYIEDITGPPSPVSINFTGPDPRVSIQGGSIPAVITLGLQGTSETKKIHINGAGLIYVE